MGWTVYDSSGNLLSSIALVDNVVATAKIADDAVTYAKLQNLGTADRVFGSTSTGVIGEVQIVPDMLATDAVTNVKVATGIDAVKLANGSVTNAELQYINSLSSNAQDQIDAKAAVGSGTPSTQTLPDTAATGSSTEAARLDHVHTMPSAGSTFLGVRVENSSHQSIANNSSVAITFDANVTQFDTDTMHSSGNPTRVTFTTAGKYWVGVSYAWAGHATGRRNVNCRKNGSTTIHRQTMTPATADEHHNGYGFIYEFSAGDYVEFVAHQTSGGSLYLVADNENSAVAMAYKIG